jgi:hypothetical protein
VICHFIYFVLARHTAIFGMNETAFGQRAFCLNGWMLHKTSLVVDDEPFDGAPPVQFSALFYGVIGLILD